MRDKILVLSVFLLAVVIITDKVPQLQHIDVRVEYFFYGVTSLAIALVANKHIRRWHRRISEVENNHFDIEGRLQDVETNMKMRKRRTVKR